MNLQIMNRAYGVEENGNLYVVEPLKSKIHTGATKINRYLEYHQDTFFSTNQRQLYRELNGESMTNDPPGAAEATAFWSNI